MKKYLVAAISCSMLLGVGSALQAAGLKKAIGGTVACGGNQLIRNGGNEFHQTHYILRNLDENNAINIDRIRFYDAMGNLIADYAGGVLPEFTNAVLGPLDKSLEPMQSAQLGTRDVFGNQGFPAAQRPLQMRLDWSASDPVYSLSVSLVRTVRQRTVTTDSQGNALVKYGEERSRHSGTCETVVEKRYWE